MPNQPLSATWDAIVVGSGLGGLSTAAYLTTNGLRTLVLEQYDTIGGSTHVFRRKRQYEFDVGVHYIGDCAPGGVLPTVLGGVGLGGRVRMLEMDPDGFSTLIGPSGTFRVPRGWDRYTERIAAAFPAEERQVRRCVEILRHVGERADQLGAPVGPRQTVEYAARHPRAASWMLRPLSQLFRATGISAAAQAVILAENGVYAAPPSRAPVGIHAGVMNHYLRSGAWYPQGGGQVLAAHLLDVVTSHGGEVRTHHPVSSILVHGGRATGVRLRDGEILAAPVVISNADIKRTFTELLGREHLSRYRNWRVNRYRMALPLFCVYLGLDIDLREHLPNTNLWYRPTDDLESLYQAAYRGEIDELLTDPPVYITSATLKDPQNPHLAPPGHSCLQVMTVVPPGYGFWNVANGPAAGERYRRQPDYVATKERVSRALVDKAVELVPQLAGHIVYAEGATPLTQERFTLTSDGACYGLELAWDQFGPFRPGPDSGIEGLYLTGGSTVWCHGISGVLAGGVGTAGAILGRDLQREIRAGRVFGDPSLLTAGGSGWDPLLASRRLNEKSRTRRGRAPVRVSA